MRSGLFTTTDRVRSTGRRSSKGLNKSCGLLLACLGMLVLTGTGCGAAKEPEEREDSAQEASLPGQEEAEETQEQPPEDDGLLDYVDSWGEQHTMEVDPSVLENPYDPALFVQDPEDPQRIVYQDPAYSTRHGIDVSEFQGEIDWEAVREAGYSFVFVRVGYRGYGEKGVLCEDKTANQNLKGAKEAGLKVGAYFFSQALTEGEAREEADLSIQILDRAGVTLDLPLMYDPELIRHDEGRANDISREQVALNTKAFRQRAKEAGIRTDIYSNLPWEDRLFDGEILNACRIWYADYEKKPQTPYHFTWWQYSDTGQVPGIEGAVDLDLWIRKKKQK